MELEKNWPSLTNDTTHLPVYIATDIKPAENVKDTFTLSNQMPFSMFQARKCRRLAKSVRCEVSADWSRTVVQLRASSGDAVEIFKIWSYLANRIQVFTSSTLQTGLPLFRNMWASSVQCRHWTRHMKKQALYHMPGWLTLTEQVQPPCDARVLKNIYSVGFWHEFSLRLTV